MAQPKRRWSKARTHAKRSTWKKEQPAYTTCPHCHEPVMPHRVCKNCGYYDGKEVIAKKESYPCLCLLVEPISHAPDSLNVKRLFRIWLDFLA